MKHVKKVDLDNENMHYTKKQLGDKRQAKEVLHEQSQQADTAPASGLNAGARKVYQTLVKAAEETDANLTTLDYYTQLSMLANSLYLYWRTAKVVYQIEPNVDDKQRPAAITQLSQYETSVNKLMKSLGLDRNTRIRTLLNNVENEAINDPIGEFLAND